MSAGSTKYLRVCLRSLTPRDNVSSVFAYQHIAPPGLEHLGLWLLGLVAIWIACGRDVFVSVAAEHGKLEDGRYGGFGGLCRCGCPLVVRVMLVVMLVVPVAVVVVSQVSLSGAVFPLPGGWLL